MICQGTLLWFDVDAFDPSLGAVLECTGPGCGFITVTGNFNDEAHANADVLREGLAS